MSGREESPEAECRSVFSQPREFRSFTELDRAVDEALRVRRHADDPSLRERQAMVQGRQKKPVGPKCSDCGRPLPAGRTRGRCPKCRRTRDRHRQQRARRAAVQKTLAQGSVDIVLRDGEIA